VWFPKSNQNEGTVIVLSWGSKQKFYAIVIGAN